MNILILGGTRFVGRHLTDVALARGHQVTHFNRGQSKPEGYPKVEHLCGDRLVDLGALKGRTWDAVIDTSAYIPRAVRMAAEALKGAIGHYTFISTISVYDVGEQEGIHENSPLITLPDETTEEVTGDTYGGLKVLCEHTADEILMGQVLHIRPGLIVGPHDTTDRFTYWVKRAALGGEMLAPGHSQTPVQVIDGRDLAEFTLSMVERDQKGVYNATGPQQRLSFAEMLNLCDQVGGNLATFTWVDEEFLGQHVAPGSRDVPLYVPQSHKAIMTIDIRKALEAGLRLRPLLETARDTLAWEQARPIDEKRHAGLTPEREAELLRLWHERERTAGER